MLVFVALQTNVPKCSCVTLLMMSFAPDIERFVSTGQNVKLACWFVFEMRSFILLTAFSSDNFELLVAAGFSWHKADTFDRQRSVAVGPSNLYAIQRPGEVLMVSAGHRRVKGHWTTQLSVSQLQRAWKREMAVTCWEATPNEKMKKSPRSTDLTCCRYKQSEHGEDRHFIFHLWHDPENFWEKHLLKSAHCQCSTVAQYVQYFMFWQAMKTENNKKNFLFI